MPRTAITSKSNLGGPPNEEDLHLGGGGDGNNDDRGNARRTSMTGIVVLMAASTMTFAAFFSAVVVRRGLSTDWTHFPFPRVLWLNTAILLASSVVLNVARRALRRGNRRSFNWLWSAGTLLGAAFLGGQIIAWLQLQHDGIYLAGKPSSAFFYILTWAHAAHAIGGLIALAYVCLRAWQYRLGPAKRTAVDVSTYFWHFLDVLWIGLVLMFYVWS